MAWNCTSPRQNDKVREVISIPEELEAFAIIPCGYPVQIKNQQNHYEKERVHFVE